MMRLRAKRIIIIIVKADLIRGKIIMDQPETFSQNESDSHDFYNRAKSDIKECTK